MSQVSCRVLGVAFDALTMRNIDVQKLIEGLPYTEQQLRETHRRVEWDVMVEIVERLEALVGGRSVLEQIGYEHLSTPSYSNVRKLASFFTSARDLYWLGTSWFGPNLFGITNDRVETLPDGRILEVIEIPEPYAPCPALFHIICGALRATPSLIGMPDSLVEADIQPRKASFIILPPEKRFSLRRKLRRLLSPRSKRQFVEELRIQQEQLTLANQSLERTVRELRESEARLTAILELDSDVRYAVRRHLDGRCDQLWLTGELASFGEKPASYDLERGGARIHPDDRARFDSRFEAALGESVHRLRYRVMTEKGNLHWIQESIRPDPGSAGLRRRADARPSSMLYHGTLKDVTSQARTELEMRRLVSAVDQANEGIVVVAPDLEVIYANSAFHRMLRREPGSLVGANLHAGLDEQSLHVTTALTQQVQESGIGHGRFDVRTPHGAPSIVDATVAAVFGVSETPESYVGIVRDVTREVELEGQIRFAAHMDALGQLAGGLAHDFNNLLMVIQAEAEMLLNRESTDAAARVSLHQIGEAAGHGEHLVHQLFTLSRTEKDDPQLLDANEVAEGFVSFVRGTLAPNINITLEAGVQMPPIRFGRARLLQILVNLAFNARDALPEGGLVNVTTSLTEIDAAQAEALNLNAGPHVAISVQDSGVGMTAEIRSRIFEPLFSTKELGHGSGMGLTTAQRSMWDMQGAIDVRSEPGEGSTFTLYFPPVGGAAEVEGVSSGLR